MKSYRRRPTHQWWREAHDRYPTGMIRLGSIGVPKPMLPPMPCTPEQSVSGDTPEALASVLIQRIQACALRGFYFAHWLELGVGYARFQVVYRGMPSHISLRIVQLRHRSPRQLKMDLRATFRALHGRWAIVAVIYDTPCRFVAVARRLPQFADMAIAEPTPPLPLKHDDAPAPPDPLASVPPEIMNKVRRLIAEGRSTGEIFDALLFAVDMKLVLPLLQRCGFGQRRSV